MPTRITIKAGIKFNRWTVIKEVKGYISPGGRELRKFLCECSCIDKTKAEVLLSHLRTGSSKSCGCFHSENLSKRAYKHGFGTHKLYYVWYDMIKRCYKEKATGYHNYGGRKIKICKQWRGNPEGLKNFIEWALKNKWKEGLQIDRKDHDLNYTPDNCRFVTRKKNLSNRRNTVMCEVDGKFMPFKKFWEKHNTGVLYRTALSRFELMGWDIYDAVTKPIKKKKIFIFKQ